MWECHLKALTNLKAEWDDWVDQMVKKDTDQEAMDMDQKVIDTDLEVRLLQMLAIL